MTVFKALLAERCCCCLSSGDSGSSSVRGRRGCCCRCATALGLASVGLMVFAAGVVVTFPSMFDSVLGYVSERNISSQLCIQFKYKQIYSIIEELIIKP